MFVNVKKKKKKKITDLFGLKKKKKKLPDGHPEKFVHGVYSFYWYFIRNYSYLVVIYTDYIYIVI
jgi:hypothetical protein